MFLHRKNSPSANVHGRTFRTVPAGVFCTLLASAPPICKLRGLLSIYADGYFRTSTDGRGVKQQRCFLLEQKTRHQNAQGWAWDRSETSFGKNLSSPDVHGRTSGERYTDVHLLIRHLLRCIIKSVHPCTLRHPCRY